jgi:hypothetical protein
MDPLEPQQTGWPGVADVDAAADAPPVSHFPLPGWPAQPTVEYFTKLILLGLLLLALPFLLGSLILQPIQTLAATSGAAMSSVAPLAK